MHAHAVIQDAATMLQAIMTDAAQTQGRASFDLHRQRGLARIEAGTQGRIRHQREDTFHRRVDMDAARDDYHATP